MAAAFEGLKDIVQILLEHGVAGLVFCSMFLASGRASIIFLVLADPKTVWTTPQERCGWIEDAQPSPLRASLRDLSSRSPAGASLRLARQDNQADRQLQP